MPLLRLLLILPALIAVAYAEIPTAFRGDWLLINGADVVHLDADGTLAQPLTGGTGPLTLKPDGSFTWNLAGRSVAGRLADGKLFLKNELPDAPEWSAFLEYRRIDTKTAAQVIAFAQAKRAESVVAFEKIRNASISKAITNNLRQLDSACAQFFLEKNTSHATLGDLIGDTKYIRALRPVDGEDYATLNLSQGEPWTITGKSGITVKFARQF